MSSVAPPIQNCEALQPIRYDPIRIQLCTLGDNCNDMLDGSPSTVTTPSLETTLPWPHATDRMCTARLPAAELFANGNQLLPPQAPPL